MMEFLDNGLENQLLSSLPMFFADEALRSLNFEEIQTNI